MPTKKIIVPINKSDLSHLHLGKNSDKLNHLSRLELPIPESFVITPEAFIQFISSENLNNKLLMQLKNVDQHDPHALHQVSKNIQKLISHHQFPKSLHQDLHSQYKKSIKTNHFQLKSSPLHHHKIYSKIDTIPKKGDVVFHESLRQIWADQFTPQAISDWHLHNHLPIFPIIVSCFYKPDISGDIYTNNPITSHKSQVLITALRGVDDNQELISDQYQVDKKTQKIVSQSIVQQDYMLQYDHRGHLKKKVVPKKIRSSPKLDSKTIQHLLGQALAVHHQQLMPIKLSYIIFQKQLFFTNFELISEHHQQDLKLKQAHSQGNYSGQLIAKGLPASPGIVSAPVRLITDLKRIPQIQSGEIVVTTVASANIIPALKKSSGIVTELGGPTSHAAIIAREVGCPAVTSAPKITKLVKTGDIISLDGNSGEIFQGGASTQPISAPVMEEKPTHRQTIPNTITKVMVSLSSPTSTKLINSPSDGIGLVRGDILLTEFGYHPQQVLNKTHKKKFQEFLFTNLNKISSYQPDSPTIYSASNLFSTHYHQLKGALHYEPTEPNPLLGYHGSLRIMTNPSLFEVELQVISKLRQDHHHNHLYLTLPFVRTAQEIRAIKQIIASNHLSRNSKFKLFLNLETPASILNLNKFAKVGFDGFIINSNILTSLTTGIDPNNTEVNQFFNPQDQAVLKLIRFAADTAREQKLEAYLYGQILNTNSDIYQKIVEWGLTGVIVDPAQVRQTRETLSHYEIRKIS